MNWPQPPRQVYFAQRQDAEGLVKIGVSAFLDWRLRDLGWQQKVALGLLASAPGDFPDEGRVHRHFAADRVKGEWFNPSAELLAFAAQAAETGEIPPTRENPRDTDFARRYLGGETLKAIGDDHGLSRERVRQILRAAGVPSLGHRTDVAMRGQWRRHYGSDLPPGRIGA